MALTKDDIKAIKEALKPQFERSRSEINEFRLESRREINEFRQEVRRIFQEQGKNKFQRLSLTA